VSSLNAKDGYIMVDNRVAPVPDELLLRGGAALGMSRGLFEGATLHCKHCGAVVVKNPDRTRDRPMCRLCFVYICDGCDAVQHQPGYVHHTFEELCDLMQSGKYQLAGSASAPILIPIGASDDGKANLPGS
jgi:hypothetical protein